ncbi:unnamed protein product [Pedinophyceae sp. YPF-701]|nr:unnamed protein product [Pedinophyceae sp. YPF-701]
MEALLGGQCNPVVALERGSAREARRRVAGGGLLRTFQPGRGSPGDAPATEGSSRMGNVPRKPAGRQSLAGQASATNGSGQGPMRAPAGLDRSETTSQNIIRVFSSQVGNGEKSQPGFDIDITKENFAPMLDEFRRALAEPGALFCAFDLEMSGLMADGAHGKLDSLEERYMAMRGDVQQFLTTQFGACVVSQDGSRLVAKSFNFNVFPRSGTQKGPRKFLCDAGALEFLANNHFDFSKWVHRGISFGTLADRDEALKRPYVSPFSREGVTDMHLRDDLKAFVEELRDKVREWLAGAEPEYLTEPLNGFFRKIVWQELTKDHSETLGTEYHPAFIIETVPSDNWRAPMRFLRATPAEVAAHEAAKEREWFDGIHAKAGFSCVLELIRDSNLPVVGHNMLFDLMFVMNDFVQSPLPPSWAGFRQLTQEYFPAGVYDTKYLAKNDLFDVFGYDSGLADAYATAVGAAREEETERWFHAAEHGWAPGAGEQDGEARQAEPVTWRRPKVEHGKAYKRYQDLEGGALAHEAGYDAYMTAVVFAFSLRLLDAKRTGQGTKAATKTMGGMLGGTGAAREVKGRVAVVGTDYPCFAVSGEQPPVDRSHVVVVYDNGGQVNSKDVMPTVHGLKVGRVFPTARKDGTALYLSLAPGEDLAPETFYQKVRGASFSALTPSHEVLTWTEFESRVLAPRLSAQAAGLTYTPPTPSVMADLGATARAEVAAAAARAAAAAKALSSSQHEGKQATERRPSPSTHVTLPGTPDPGEAPPPPVEELRRPTRRKRPPTQDGGD